MYRRSTFISAIAIALSLFVVSSAWGVGFQFEGVVGSVDWELGGTGESRYGISGVCAFDATVSDSSATDGFGMYLHALSQFDFEIRNFDGVQTYAAHTTDVGGTSTNVRVNGHQGVAGRWDFYSCATDGPNVDELVFQSVELQFYSDHWPRIDSLPSHPPILSDFYDADFLLTFSGTSYEEPWEGGEGEPIEIYREYTIGGYLTSITAAPVHVSGGIHQSGSIRGGGGVRGGVDFEFAAVNADGDVTLNYMAVDPTGNLSRFGLHGFEFDPAGSMAQVWDLGFDGDPAGEILLTFGYDEELIGDIPEDQLMIAHFAGGQWELLDVAGRDAGANTITVRTDSLSPFVLSVPEPATLALLLTGGLTLLRRR